MSCVNGIKMFHLRCCGQFVRVHSVTNRVVACTSRLATSCMCSQFYIMVRDESLEIVDPLSYFSFQPVLHDWCNKRPWYVLSCLWDGAYKRTLAVNR